MRQRGSVVTAVVPIPDAATLGMVASACFVAGMLYVSVAVHRWGLVVHPAQRPLDVLASSEVVGVRAFAAAVPPDCWNRPAPVWPHRMVLSQTRTPDADSKVGPAATILYYDYDSGANLIRIAPLDGGGGPVTWDLELDDHRSYYYVPSERTCKFVEFPVGVLRPDWLAGATPLGPFRRPRRTDDDDIDDDDDHRWVCGWTKEDFIDYYADASTGAPASWYFHNMKATFTTLNFTAPGEPSWTEDAIDPALFVPPDYCFS